MHPSPPPRTALQPITGVPMPRQGSGVGLCDPAHAPEHPMGSGGPKSGRAPVFAQSLPCPILCPLLLFSGLPSGNRGHQNPTSGSALRRPDLSQRDPQGQSLHVHYMVSHLGRPLTFLPQLRHPELVRSLVWSRF